jgi:hypothetical protein
MKRLLSLIVFASLAGGSSSLQAADSWIFLRSYYSHDPVSEVRIGRQFSTGPVFTRPQGQYVKSGYRQIRSIITTQGQTYDNLNVLESWIQTGSKF